jgi:2-polyprenyl-6-hydroxyphenyl methylase / 3-demethylubiquinone-9 3-methyltransferase
MTQDTIQNVDANELAKFAELAHRWWDSSSEFKPLHEINPLRLDWIDHLVTLQGKRVVDVGCGGGILTEAMAARGAQVCGIDLGEKALGVARLHLLESGYEVDYQCVSAEDFAAAYAGEFDLVTCMELLEHVPDPASTVAACAALAKPGAWCIFSTINRNLKAYLYAVIGAEYVLNLLPRGTHDYAKFLRPSELGAMARGRGLTVEAMTGVTYNPLGKKYSLVEDTSVNYIMATRHRLDTAQ